MDVDEYAKGYALAYQQAKSLGGIDKILWIKLESEELRELTKETADAADVVAEDLSAYAETASLSLEPEYLPAVEALARDKMAQRTMRQLVAATGCDFQHNLLFSQSIAAGRLLGLAVEMEERAPDEAQRALWQRVVERVQPVEERIRASLGERCVS